MPEYEDYYLFENSPSGILIESISLIDIITIPIETNLCMEGLEYKVTWLDEDVTEATRPVELISADLDAVVVRLYTEDE